MSGMVQTFSDNFQTMDITADGGAGRWYAPIHSNYGAGVFKPPGVDGIYSLTPDGLQIEAKKVNGTWESGTMQTVDSHGSGFVQQYGYFEMTASFPAGAGPWPAFWLLSQNGFTDKTKTRTEIDAVEWYGSDPRGHHASVHLWPSNPLQPGSVTSADYQSKYYNMTSLLTDGQWAGLHTYGVAVTPDWVITYLDHQELERFPTVDEFKTPLYMLVSLAVLPADADAAVGPLDMVVTNVSAYQFTSIPEPAGATLLGIGVGMGLMSRSNGARRKTSRRQRRNLQPESA
jgi:beta-glucanase (GH16 family)